MPSSLTLTPCLPVPCHVLAHFLVGLENSLLFPFLAFCHEFGGYHILAFKNSWLPRNCSLAIFSRVPCVPVSTNAAYIYIYFLVDICNSLPRAMAGHRNVTLPVLNDGRLFLKDSLLISSPKGNLLELPLLHPLHRYLSSLDFLFT